MISNKRGGEKVLSIWWFFVIAIIGAAIVGGVLIFYGQEINTKGAEAESLSSKITNCLIDNGKITDNYFTSGFDIYSQCGLAKDLFGKGSNFFFRVRVLDENGKIISGNGAEIIGGDTSFEGDCAIIETGEVKAVHYPMCSRKVTGFDYVASDGSLKKYSIIVIAGSNQQGRQEIVA